MNHAFLGLQQREAPAKIRQEDLAARVGKRIGKPLTQAAGQGWLTGSVPRDLETMEALADELRVDTNWLYFERGAPPPGWVALPTPTGLRPPVAVRKRVTKTRPRKKEAS